MTGSENNKRDIFRNRMLEASFLSNADPRRVEIERLVSGEESWAAEEWARLVEENDRWRGELCGVNVPAKLEENLLAIAAGRGSAVSFTGFFTGHNLLRLAAAAILIVAVGWSVSFYRGRSVLTHEVEKVAELALVNHVTDQDVTVITLDPDYLQEHLRSNIPFEIVLPAVNNLSLIGGRPVSLGTHPVLYTRWASGSGRCSLYQFRSSDFNLPEQTEKEVVSNSRVNCPDARDKNCNVVIWTESGRGYALVADNQNAQNCVSSNGDKP